MTQTLSNAVARDVATFLDDEAAWLSSVRESLIEMQALLGTLEPQRLLALIRRQEALAAETERRTQTREALQRSFASRAAGRAANGNVSTLIAAMPEPLRPAVRARQEVVLALAEEVAELSSRSRGLVRVCLAFGNGLLEQWTGSASDAGLYSATGEHSRVATSSVFETES